MNDVMEANMYIRIPEVVHFGSCSGCAAFSGRGNHWVLSGMAGKSSYVIGKIKKKIVAIVVVVVVVTEAAVVVVVIIIMMPLFENYF